MKKVLSILLCAVMMFSAIPMHSFAAHDNATATNPNVIEFDKWYSGGWYADNEEEHNYYIEFTITSQSLVTFEFTKPFNSEGEYEPAEFLLYDAANTETPIWQHYSVDEKEDGKTSVVYIVGLSAGTYILNVLPFYMLINDYTAFNYKFSVIETEFCETEFNNTKETADLIQLGNFYKGYYGTAVTFGDGADHYDYYKFQVKSGRSYRIRFRKGAEELLDSTTLINIIDNATDSGNIFDLADNHDSSGYAYFEFTAKDSGYAYLQFENYIGIPIEYEFEVLAKCAAPKLGTPSNTSTGVKVTWSKTEDADTYTVYRKSNNGSYKAIKSDLTGTSYIDTTAKSGTKYTYTVRGVNVTGPGDYNTTGKSIIYLSTPKLSSVNNTNGGIDVKWNKLTGAKGYYIYRKSGNNGWSKIADVTTNAYTDKSAKSGTTYKYTVKAYNGKTVSAYNTNGISIKYLTMPKLSSVTNVNGGVTLKWGKVTGASGYYVYRKTGNNGWSKIATVSGNGKISYTDKTAKSGTTYKYTVKAYNGKTVSAYNTTGLSIKYLAVPQLNGVSSAKAGVTVKWCKVTGASGYYVYRKTGNGDFKKIATVSGNGKVSYLDKGAKKGTTYTYTVKAYSGKTVSAHNASGLKIKDKY